MDPRSSCLFINQTDKTDKHCSSEIGFLSSSYGKFQIADYHRRIAGGRYAKNVPENLGTGLHARLDFESML